MKHLGAVSCSMLEHVSAGCLFLVKFFWGGKRNGNQGCRFSKKGVLEERMKRMCRIRSGEWESCFGGSKGVSSEFSVIFP